MTRTLDPGTLHLADPDGTTSSGRRGTDAGPVHDGDSLRQAGGALGWLRRGRRDLDADEVRAGRRVDGVQNTCADPFGWRKMARRRRTGRRPAKVSRQRSEAEDAEGLRQVGLSRERGMKRRGGFLVDCVFVGKKTIRFQGSGISGVNRGYVRRVKGRGNLYKLQPGREAPK